MKIASYITTLIIIIGWTSCEPHYQPKRKGYPRVEIPEKKYQLFDKPGFPYSFEYPVYANIIRDTAYFGEPTENPYWINIDFPSLGGKIYVSYKQVGKYSISRLIDDAFNLTYKHAVKADAIEDMPFTDAQNHKYAVIYNVKGDAATAKQFYVTDSTAHFMRGALYFDVTPNADSLQIVNDFLEKDMVHLIETLKWK